MIAGSITPKGSHLADLRLVREADGTIRLFVTEMDSRLIETTGEEVSDRIKIVADWVAEGAANMLREWAA